MAKILEFPGPGENPEGPERKDTESPPDSEGRGVELDQEKAALIRKLEKGHTVTEAKRVEVRESVSDWAFEQKVIFINNAPDEEIKMKPTFFSVLLDMVKDYARSRYVASLEGGEGEVSTDISDAIKKAFKNKHGIPEDSDE